MPLIKRSTAVFLCLALVLAQGQDAFAAVHAVVSAKAGGAAAAAAAVGGASTGLTRPGPGALPRFSPALSGALSTVALTRAPRAGAAAVLPGSLFAAPSSLPVAVAVPAQAAPPVVSPVPAAALPVLQRLAAPESAVPGAPISAGAAGRFNAAFDGSLARPVQALAEVFAATGGAGEDGALRPTVRPASDGAGEVPGPKTSAPHRNPSAVWSFIKANRFLIAGAAGAAVGLAGVNLAALPLLSLTPGLFFGALPWLAAPFIGLNVYKSFAHYSVIKESRTLLGFLVITAAGLAISAGVTMAMTALLPVVDPASIVAAAIPGLTNGGFSPMQFMLPIIALFTGAALIYKRARAVNEGSAKREYGSDWKGSLLRLIDRAVGLVINVRTAPFLEKAGRLGEKGTDLINKIFPMFIDVLGIPAVTVLLSMTMATGGLGLLSAFGGYYITAMTGLAVGFAALLATYFAFGARAKDFREILKAALFGFSISSSSATMPTEKETLKAMGVSRKTRDTVVPLGGVFNMFGTALYLGLTAFYALSMFGAAPTLAQYLNTALSVLVIAMGAPGIPASNITLLDPVLRETGLQSGQISKIYTMILPADRPLDMVQTALNVLGDMLPAVEQERHRLRYVRVKHIREIREKRAAEGRPRG